MIGTALRACIDASAPFPAYGYVIRVATGLVEADGPLASMGSICHIDCSDGTRVIAEVIAVWTNRIVLAPFVDVTAMRPGDRVSATTNNGDMPVGDAFAGRAVDAFGRAIDRGGDVTVDQLWRSSAGSILDRVTPGEQIETGVRALDGLLPLGIGQRVGIFAASGAGKTRLMEQLAVQCQCDHVVVCQIGERGREVEALWRQLKDCGEIGRATLVAATSDESAPMRVRAVYQALAIAEYWREAGRHVVLLVDSITRLAMALRETGLAAGEPPTVRAFTPNVMRALPIIVERCGLLSGRGAITAVFTVLAENDDMDDPIVEIMRSLLDGHILLSRQLAERAHYPAIDIARSVSRLADQLMTIDQQAAANQFRQLLACYDDARILIESGLYAKGSDAAIDSAIAANAAMTAFLKQPSGHHSALAATTAQLHRIAADTVHG
jgi:flagellum-specific ATP synthase